MAKRKRDLKAYQTVAERSGGLCERCGAKAETMHHRRLRIQLGADSALNLRHLCAPCHVWTHANPMQAALDGWIVSAKYSDPELYAACGA